MWMIRVYSYTVKENDPNDTYKRAVRTFSVRVAEVSLLYPHEFKTIQAHDFTCNAVGLRKGKGSRKDGW